MSTWGSTFDFFDVLDDVSEHRKTLYDFKIGPVVEEGMNNARILDRRRVSRMYRSGVTSEQHVHVATTKC